ncbi:hypothetical protein QBC38DRAFT_448931 [Podospora fimiseda]|uniref:Uncharacterized protein n=1 Tax=Podospora fimiseda TaxID=252190 RepID=A0AAN6YMW5_9PEZI|nr:hypothetical protein QBC38DRAFT_448931 [Podospora fimiseda]
MDMLTPSRRWKSLTSFGHCLRQHPQGQRGCRDKWLEWEKQKAKATYASDYESGFTTIPKFYDWLLDGNAPAYNAANNNATAIASKLQELQNMMNGTLATKINTGKANIAKAKDQSGLKKGFNMEAAASGLLSASELKRLQQSGDNAPKPSIYYVPQYTELDEYKQFVQAAEAKAVTSNWKPANSYDLKIDKNKRVEDYKFGQTTAGGSVGVSCGPWFAFGASASHSETSTDSSSQVATEDVSVKILYDDIRLVPINPDQWYVFSLSLGPPGCCSCYGVKRLGI